MSYAGLGQVSGGITSGTLAKTDPFVSRASLMAANVMTRLADVPAAERRAWLRRQLNGLWPGMGDGVLANIDRMNALGGKSRDQVLYDSIRLALANRLIEWAGTEAKGMSGLGDFASDARTFACTSASMGATVGGFVGAFRTGSDTSILSGATTASGISNCNLDTLRLQAETATAQANIAANAAVATAASQRTTMLVGVLGLAVIIGGVAVMKK